jgi:hypothetical protein
MYVNGKMRTVETISRTGRGTKENDRKGEFKYLVYCKNFRKGHNVLPAQQ